jgi:Tfp pilus assembly protein PilF
VALLRRARDAFPGDFWINHDLGSALQECRPPQHDEAIRFLTAAVALRPASPGARFNLGHALCKKGRLDDAAAAFRQAIDRKADYTMAHHNLGLLLRQMGRFDEAAAAFREQIRLQPQSAGVHFNLGLVLLDGGHLDEAAAAWRRATELKPDYAEAHCNLGLVLQQQGDFASAVATLQRGHELGSARADWAFPSAEWVKECRRLGELDGRLPALLRGEVRPAGAAECGEFAHLCSCKKLYADAARLWADAFAADAELAADLRAQRRYDAACVAALAAAGLLPDPERARWRRQALRWLRADLAAYRRLLEGDKPQDRRLVEQRLRHWQHDPDLAGLRDPAAQGKLPGAERQAWEELWTEVGVVLSRAGS